jgi:hypothetical protein
MGETLAGNVEVTKSCIQITRSKLEMLLKASMLKKVNGK